MTLFEYMRARGWVRSGMTKCICPFHGDHSPSAVLNANSLFCFAESRLYTLWDFYQAFGVFLDRVPEEDSGMLNMINGKFGYSYNQVLRSFPFQIKDS